MKPDPELRALVEAGRFDEIEDRWMERLESSPSDTGFFLAALQALLRAGQEGRATPLVQLLLEVLGEQASCAAELEFVRPALRLWPQSPLLRPALFGALRRAYADRPSLERMLQHFGLAAAVDPQAALEQIETWLRYDVGRGVLLSGRGPGRVAEINLALAILRVEFPNKERLSLRLGEAERLLVPLEPGHFLAEKLEHPEVLGALAELDPGAILEKLFASLGGPLAVAELKEHLSGIVPEEKWAAWWKRASADVRLASTGGRRPGYTWSVSGAEAEEALRAAFDAAPPREKLELARKHAGRSATLAAHLARGLADVAAGAVAGDPALALEAVLTLERLPAPDAVAAAGGSIPNVAELLAAADPVPLVAGVEDRTLRERAMALLQERRPEWPDHYARLLRAETDGRSLAFLYDALQRAGHHATLDRTVDDVLARPTAAPRLFLWLAREMRRRPELDGHGNWGLLRRLLDALTQEAFRSLRGPLRELFDDEGLGEHLAERLTLEQAEQLHELLLRDLGLDEHCKDRLRRAVLRRHPELREAEEEVLLTTAEALERKRAEFEQIVRVDIPRNAEELRKAAAHGDLSENFEYRAARDRHEMLSSRAKTLHEELRRARTLDPATIDVSCVRVGTRIRLDAAAGGEARVLVILGPWDSDPARGVYSYLAPAVQPLLGKTTGDLVQFLEGQYVVGEIRVWIES